jgi:hypothetical protein
MAMVRCGFAVVTVFYLVWTRFLVKSLCHEPLELVKQIELPRKSTPDLNCGEAIAANLLYGCQEKQCRMIEEKGWN